MKIDIDDIFMQIINIQISNSDRYILKDIKLDLKEEYEYDISMNYADAYNYLCDCLLMDKENSDSRNLLDLFLVHQYLCYCYLSRDTINYLYSFSMDWEITKSIVRECFFSYRVIGAFQACIDQYEILIESEAWNQFDRIEKIQIMKEAAKSYRNRGDFHYALEVYYKCLSLNLKEEWLQRVELLLKIGKVYRNYLMQIELAKFFVEEAYIILNENTTQSSMEKEVLRYTVICYDMLGQIYRDEKNFVKAEEFFEKSQKFYGKKGGRAQIHEMLMRYQEDIEYTESDLEKDIKFLEKVIQNLEADPNEEIGIGIRSVQLGRLKFLKCSEKPEEAYDEIRRGRYVAFKYNDMKTVIRSYMEEAEFQRQSEEYEKCIKICKCAIKLASDSKQLVLENEIIRKVIDLSNIHPDLIDSATKIELVKRRKDIYKQLIEFSKYSIGIVHDSRSFSFYKDKLIDIYRIVLGDFEKILGELSLSVEMMNIEIDKINQKYLAYLNTEIKGFTYKSILHKFKNDLPNENIINKLRTLCDNIQTEDREVIIEANKQLETFANIIGHIKKSADDALKEAEYEKSWCILDSLVQNGIRNFLYSRPQYNKNIQNTQNMSAKYNIKVLVQCTLFETTISEILNNAFDYAETVMKKKDIEEKFQFFITLNVIEKRAIVLNCYSKYSDTETAKRAADSIISGMEPKGAMAAQGSRYGLYSIKLLFEELMGGKIHILQEQQNAGIRIQLPIDLVTLHVEERNNI